MRAEPLGNAYTVTPQTLKSTEYLQLEVEDLSLWCGKSLLIDVLSTVLTLSGHSMVPRYRLSSLYHGFLFDNKHSSVEST